MSDKIQLAPGQRSADYEFQGGGSLEELGRRLDQFCANVDHSTVGIGSVNLHVEVSHIRAHQSREPLLARFEHSAIITLYSRSHA